MCAHGMTSGSGFVGLWLCPVANLRLGKVNNRPGVILHIIRICKLRIRFKYTSQHYQLPLRWSVQSAYKKKKKSQSIGIAVIFFFFFLESTPLYV